MNLEELLLEQYKTALFEKMLLDEYNNLLLEAADDDDGVPGDPNKPQNITNPEEEWNDIRPNSKVGIGDNGEYYNIKIKTTKEAYDAAKEKRDAKKESLPKRDAWTEYVQAHVKPDGSHVTKEELIASEEAAVKKAKDAWLKEVNVERASLKKAFDDERNKYIEAKNAGQKPQVQKIDPAKLQSLKGESTPTKPKVEPTLDKDYLKKTPEHLQDEESLNKVNGELDSLSKQIQTGKKEDGTDLSEEEKIQLGKNIAKKLEEQTTLKGKIQLHDFKLSARKTKETQKEQAEKTYFNGLPLYAQEKRIEQIEALNVKRKELKDAGKSEDEIDREIDELEATHKTEIKDLIKSKSSNPNANTEVDEKTAKKEKEVKDLTKDIEAFKAHPEYKKMSPEEKTAVEEAHTAMINAANDEILDEEGRKAEAERIYSDLLVNTLPGIKAKKKETDEKAAAAMEALKTGKPEALKTLEEIREDERRDADKKALEEEQAQLKTAYFDKLDKRLGPIRTRQYTEIEDLYKDPTFLAKSKEDQKIEKDVIIDRHNKELDAEKKHIIEEDEINNTIKTQNSIIKSPLST
jgi:hypothetical protein